MTSDPRDSDPLPEVAFLSREIAPDPVVEERVVARLRDKGLLRAGTSPWRRWAAAAAVLIFAAGVSAGRLSVRPAASENHQSRFLLLLSGGPSGLAAEEEARVVAEYGAWAMTLRQQGRYVSGERLGEARTTVPGGMSPNAEGVRGFFIISAGSFDEATDVARSCPHARRGGSVTVRPIEPT
jgi:hypothetical protein